MKIFLVVKQKTVKDSVIFIGRSWPVFIKINLYAMIFGFILLAASPAAVARTNTAYIYHGAITINACEDLDADGTCEAGEGSLPAGTQACLRYEDTGEALGCKPVPATFENLSPGRHTAYLMFGQAGAGYYPTTPPTEINLLGCQCADCGCTTPNCQCQCECSCSAQVTLGAVYPVHPKGIAVHAGLN
ncbi:MAG: hypothetical protein GY807_09245, partial [Gammaproteobacteria bacterium]|nr:hypothetical protein [Gammaproteobacteria bacterium]